MIRKAAATAPPRQIDCLGALHSLVERPILKTRVDICRKPRMTPSRDYDEQRLGILYSLLKSEYLR